MKRERKAETQTMPRRTGHVFILRHVLLLGVRVARGVSPINTSSLPSPSSRHFPPCFLDLPSLVSSAVLGPCL